MLRNGSDLEFFSFLGPKHDEQEDDGLEELCCLLVVIHYTLTCLTVSCHIQYTAARAARVHALPSHTITHRIA